MLPAFLITFREVIEATLIVATIAGLLIRLEQRHRLPTVVGATVAAVGACILLIFGGSMIGFRMSSFYTGLTEEFVEGVLMLMSAGFIMWAVFVLHSHFAHHKVLLLQKIKGAVDQQENKVLFALVFTAIVREGIEIVLFLSTIFLQESPSAVLSGFGLGVAAGLFVSALLLTFTIRMPVYWAFRISSLLLILFSAGMLARGVNKFVELGVVPQTWEITFAFMPAAKTFAHDMIKSLFGITRTMSLLQIAIYASYTTVLLWATRSKR